MKWSRLLVIACVAASSVSLAIAQETPRLLFEVTVNGSTVARPEMRVPSGGEGRLELDQNRGDATILFTPTVRANDIAIAFDIIAGGRQFKPTLFVSRTVPVSLRWVTSTSGQEVRLQISQVQ
jgi:hypothetical protein